MKGIPVFIASFAIAATAAYTVQSGNTLSGIAAANGVSLSQVEAANPQITDPNFITVGESVNLSGGSASSTLQPSEQSSSPSSLPSAAPSSSSTDQSAGDDATSGSGSGTSSSGTTSPGGTSTPAATAPSTGTTSTGSGGSGSYSIPGMSQSMANCIAYRESTDGQNPAANGNVFGIIPASGYNVAGDSLAQQEQVAGQIYANSGGGAWAADGCAGT